MIGAKSSPLSMFTGGNSGGPSMYEIGYNAGPGGAVSNALRGTIDKYHANLAMQQEQVNKMAQIQASSGADLNKEKALIDYRRQFAAQDPDAQGPHTQVDPGTGKAFYRSTTINPTTGIAQVSWAPVSINAPERPMNQLEDAAVQPILDQMKARQAGAPTGNIIQQSAANAQVPTPVGQGVTPPQSSKPLDAQTASALLQKAGGDKNKARALAQQLGYTF